MARNFPDFDEYYGLKEFVTLKELKDEGERIDNKIERFFESGKSKKYDNKVMNLFSDIYDDLTNKGFTDTQSMRILQSIVYQAQLNYDIAVDWIMAKLPNDVFDEALTKLDKIVDFIETQIDKGYITESEAKRIWQEMFRQTKGTWKEGIFEDY